MFNSVNKNCITLWHRCFGHRYIIASKQLVKKSLQMEDNLMAVILKFIAWSALKTKFANCYTLPPPQEN